MQMTKTGKQKFDGVHRVLQKEMVYIIEILEGAVK